MISLDGKDLFDQNQLEIEAGSIRRDSLERTIAGVDGALTIDLGARSRQIKQKGLLLAKSNSKMQEKMSVISSYMDGKTHTLNAGSSGEFDNLRMDVFKVGKARSGGSGLAVDYEIVYTQLMV